MPHRGSRSRVRDDGLAVTNRQRHLGGSSVLARERDDCRTRQHVDVIPGQIVRALLTAVRQMRVDRQLDELVGIAWFWRRAIGLARARNDADADSAAAAALYEGAADGSHHATAAAG